ncbi:MAG: AAA family ATPase [Planctomycetaceae bacterium]|nr:AAA family ATPase [Planctomycetaceae bacterium]
MTSIDQSLLDTIRQRRTAGESLGKLAKEIGLTWQRLWTLLYPSPKPETLPLLQESAKGGSLVDKYRPTSLDCLWGQDAVVTFLRKFAAAPYPSALIFEGETGTGKTSAALALASALGCDLAQQEFGGVYVIASGEQTAEAVRDTARLMWNRPFYGSGWKVIIVNEADRMHPAAETIWLDRLESLPAKTVVVFTTNYAGKLSQRFRDRCTGLTFESDAQTLVQSCRQLLAAIWKRETGKNLSPGSFSQIVDQAICDGRLSFRRAVQLLTVALAKESLI